MNRLANKVALITGAAQGMGAAHARLFIAEGAKVVLTDVLVEKGEMLAAELGENALFLKHDVTKLAEWQQVVAAAAAKFGFLNVLVNNAGIMGMKSSTVELSEEAYQQVIAINQTSIFFSMKAALPALVAAGGGSIINVSSLAAFIPIIGPNIAYAASKAAIVGMTRMVASEYGSQMVRVNSIHPGGIQTPMTGGATIEQLNESLKPIVPLGRIGRPEEAAQLVLFLASDESSYISGTDTVIDGGWLGGSPLLAGS
jgi:3alpha(or 20beta)-hydroxysteroid dehydrogenase